MRRRERAPTRSKTKRGLKALLVGMLAVPTAIVLTAGTAAADGGNFTVTSPGGDCPGAGLKIEDIPDGSVIPPGTYTLEGATDADDISIRIDSNTTSSDASTSPPTKTITFTWTATDLPTGTYVSSVYVKGGTNDTPKRTTYAVGTTAGTTTWTAQSWYSHVSFCLAGVPMCPADSSQTMPTVDRNGDGDIDGDDCTPVKCPADSTQNMPSTDVNGDGSVDGDDCTPVKCPADSSQTMPSSDVNGDGDIDGDDCTPVKCPADSTQNMPSTDVNGDGSVDGDDCTPVTCPTGQSFVNGSCVPICPTGQTRNGNGTCECPAGQILVDGTCQIPPPPIPPIPPVPPLPEEEEIPEEEEAEVLPEEEVIGAPAVVETPVAPVIEAAPAAALPAQVEPPAQLPRTGGSTTGMLLQLAIGLIGMGVLLTRTSRRRTNT
jgi:hypothetical protein